MLRVLQGFLTVSFRLYVVVMYTKDVVLYGQNLEHRIQGVGSSGFWAGVSAASGFQSDEETTRAEALGCSCWSRVSSFVLPPLKDSGVVRSLLLAYRVTGEAPRSFYTRQANPQKRMNP